MKLYQSINLPTLQQSFQLVLNASAAWYLATYLTLSGTQSTAPLLLSALIAIVPLAFRRYREHFEPLSQRDYFWIFSLIGFGLWGAFSTWHHEAPIKYFETPAKFILGGVIAISLMVYKVKLRWIQAGATLGTLLLAALILREYDGQHRFSPLMNATKWGNAIAFQTILCLSLVLISYTRWERALFALLAAFGLFATLITGTRGALVPIIGMCAAIPILYWKTFTLKRVIIFTLVIGAGLYLAAQNSTLEARIKQTQNSFAQLTQDNWRTSIGIRLVMWRTGLSATSDQPLLGAGHDFQQVFDDYEAPTPGLAAARDMIRGSFENFHSIYIDTLVRSGVLGLLLLLAVFTCGLWSESRAKLLLALAPIVGFAMSGLFDSALELGITTSYLILAGSIVKAVTLPSLPPVRLNR